MMSENSRSVFSGCFTVSVMALLMNACVAFFLESACQARFDNNRPVYPGATVVSSQSIFLAYREAVYTTPDAPADVRSWYSRTLGVALREALLATGTRGDVWAGDWNVSADPAGGTRIVMSLRCN
jgi:hypothetical protein